MRRLLLILAIALLAPAAAAQAHDPFQSMGRYLGFGWSDGYHAQRTWPLSYDRACNCGPTMKQFPAPAAAPKQQKSPQVEPASPSDRPAAKTSMRRYPRG